jgi:hypothetical protein
MARSTPQLAALTAEPHDAQGIVKASVTSSDSYYR